MFLDETHNPLPQTKSPRMEFKNILDLTFVEKADYEISAYFSHITSQALVPRFISHIYVIAVILHVLCSSLFISDENIWKKDSIEYSIFNIFSIFWQGAVGFGSLPGIYAGIAAGLLLLVFFGAIIFRAFRYATTKKIIDAEAQITYVLAKYMHPLLIQFIVTPIPIEIYNIFNGINIGISVVGFIICTISTYMSIKFLSQYFSDRINFDNCLFHEWEPQIAGIKYVGLVFIDLITGCFIIGNRTWRIVVLTIYIIYQMVCGGYDFYILPYIFKLGNMLHSGSHVTAGIGGIVHIIGFFYPVSYLILLLVLIVFYIIDTLFGFRQLGPLQANLLSQYDEIMELDNAEDIQKKLEEYFPSSFKIYNAIRVTLETGHPFIFNWMLLDYGFNKYPHDGPIMMSYLRLASIFPATTEKILYLGDYIEGVKLPNPAMIRMLIMNINLQRSNSLTPRISQELDSIEAMQENLKLNKRNFWESVLKGKKDNFWSGINSIINSRNTCNSRFAQNINDYPNSIDVYEAYINYNIDYGHDGAEAKHAYTMLQRIYETTRAQPDFTFRIAFECFPSITVSEAMMDDSLEPTRGRDDPCISDQELTDVEAAQALTEHSKLAKVTFISIYLMVIQVALIALSVLFVQSFSTDVIGIIQKSVDCFVNLNSVMYGIAHYVMQVTTRYYFDQGYLESTDAVMSEFAKYTYKAGHVAMIDMPQENISAVRNEIQSYIQNFTNSLLDLSSIDCFSELAMELNEREFQDTGVSVMTYIMKVVTSQDGTEAMFQDCVSIFDYLKEKIEKTAADFSITETAENLLLLAIVVVVIETMLLALPFVLELFVLDREMDALRAEFMSLPANELQVLAESGNDSEGVSSVGLKEKSSQSALLHISFFLMVTPVIVLIVTTYFIASEFIMNNSDSAASAAYLKTNHGTIRLAMTAELHQYYYWDVRKDQAESERIREQKMKLVDRAKAESTSSLVISALQLYHWLVVEPQYVFNSSELRDDRNNIPSNGYMFDRIAAQYYTHAIDNMIFFVGVGDPGGNASKSWLYSHLYWYNQYAQDRRDKPFFDVILTNLKMDVRSADPIFQALLILIVVIQVVSYALVLFVISSFRQKLLDAVWVLREVPLHTILSCTRLLKLLTDGTIDSNDEISPFQNAEEVLEKTDTIICLLDRNMAIVDVNAAALNFLGDGCVGRNIIDIFDAQGQWQETLVNIHGIPEGKGELQFSSNADVVKDGETHYLSITVSSLTSDHVALTGEARDVETIILAMQDVTEDVKFTKDIEKQSSEFAKVLSSLLPPQITEQLCAGQEMVAMIVQSITMADIRVEIMKEFDLMSDEQHHAVQEIFKVFDRNMTDFPLLSKCWTFTRTYTLAGGLFSSVNKPDRHAEETIRYCIRLLNEMPEVSKTVGAKINLTIGVHTGGPIIAGCMSTLRPNFLIVGDVPKVTSLMKNSSRRDSIHVSRPVYELIYSSGFNVAEFEDCAISPGVTLSTYIITP